MSKFIIGTFLILGWTFYEMSGGADFEPEQRTAAVAEPVQVDTTPVVQERVAEAVAEPEAVQVTRASSLSLASLTIDEPTADAVADETAVQDAVAVAAAPVTPEVEIETPAPLDLRAVAGNRVNMRDGPGTNFGVIDTLPRGTEAEVLEVNLSGWARIRITETDQEGWMAERLLTEG